MSLTLLANEPLTQSNLLYSRTFIEDITSNHEGYTHTISANGGFDTAKFTLKGTKDYLDDWFNDGLMRRIEMLNPEGIQIWEGFVSKLKYNNGSLVKTKSVDTMYNRVHLRYSPLDTTVNPPIASPPLNLILNDIDSQDKYGVKTGILSGGERQDFEAYDWGRTVLRESKQPKVGENVNILSSNDASIEIDCKGYFHTLKWIPYISANTTGTIQAQQVFIEVLEYFNTQNPGWFPLDFGWFDYNFRSQRRGWSNLQTCWEVINEIILNGGLGGERWVGGVYQDRRLSYKQAEDIFGLYGQDGDLYRFLDDPSQAIYDTLTGTQIMPWDMLPDKVLKTVDVLGDNDMYIEQVTYTAPYGLTLVGGDDQRLSIFLKQKGLPGL